jgi:MFS family permease
LETFAKPHPDDLPSRQPEELFTPRFWLACSVHFTGAMGASFYILLPLFIRLLGGSEITIGVYTAVAGGAAVLARIPVGRLLDTQGRWRVLVAAGALHALSWLAFVWVDAFGATFTLLVIAHGIAGGTLFAGYFTYASDIAPVTRRSEGIAMFGIWGMLPNGLGPALGEFLIARGGFAAFFVTAAAFAFASLTLSMLLPETATAPHPEPSTEEPAPAGPPYRALLPLLLTTLMFGVAINSVFTFLAPFAYAHGRGGVGRFFLTYSFAAVAVRVLTGRLPDRIGLHRVLIPALALLGIGLLLLPHVVNPVALIAVGVLCGAGHGYSFPILGALAVEEISPAHRGRVMSWFTAMFDLGTTLANPLLGAIAEWAGYVAMFSTAGIGLLLTAGVFSRAGTRRVSPS